MGSDDGNEEDIQLVHDKFSGVSLKVETLLTSLERIGVEHILKYGSENKHKIHNLLIIKKTLLLMKEIRITKLVTSLRYYLLMLSQ